MKSSFSFSLYKCTKISVTIVGMKMEYSDKIGLLKKAKPAILSAD